MSAPSDSSSDGEEPTGQREPGLVERLLSPRPSRPMILPSTQLLARTMQRVFDRYDSAGDKPETDPARLLRDLRRRIEANDWRKVPMSFVTRAARVAFDAPLRDTEEAHIARRFLLAEVRASTKQGFLGPMVRIYISSWTAGAEHTEALGTALEAARTRIGGRWLRLIRELPELFVASRATEELATRMIRMDDPWQELRALGLREPHGPGLMDAVHLAFVSDLGPRLTERPEVDRLLAWLRPAGQSARQVGASEAINALLRPWQQRDPPNDIKSLLIDRLTEVYGHPRVNRNPAWNRVDPALQAKLLRWISGADIRFLFRVLTEAERGHMWEEREAFWWTLHQQGRIDEVWVAFNGEGHRIAMQKLPPDSRQAGLRFGKQVGDKDKSLLIMRIGNQIVVEGTYNFMVHGFSVNDTRAPKLYERSYDVAEIRYKPSVKWKQVHNGNWQGRVVMNL